MTPGLFFRFGGYIANYPAASRFVALQGVGFFYALIQR
jgi:hypothetical protein